ncbi:MAG TPA: porin [Porticoccaceae bacterium]|nr:porin [Porticoccaceae bacterium]HIG66731.1 porin [Porticoccaceae bacterium]HIK80898.1 porin [Porticoccaceae bacterium]
MKELLLILALSFTSFSFAEWPIGGKVYGKANLSLVSQDGGGTSEWNLNSNASRLGIKGESKISEELGVVYQAEYEVCIDSGDCKGQTFKQRNTFLGLKGSFGMVWAGKHDTPTKLAAKKVDLFNDLEGDIKNAFEGENRVSNVVAYTSPKMNGFSATLAMIPAEGEDVDQDGQDDTGLNDGLSYSINYTKGDLYLAIAGDQEVDEQDLVRMIAQYQIDALKLGFLYQQNEDNLGAKDESGYFVSAAYTLSADITLKAQYGAIEDDIDGDEEQTLSLGADYKLDKNTKIFIFYTNNTDSEVGLSDDEFTAFGIGMEHNF